jgi:DAPG hydrolase PhiG domain
MPYLGYKEDDFKTPFSKFFDEKVGEIQQHVVEILGDLTRQFNKAIPSIENVDLLAQDGYSDFETGFTLERNGEIRVAVLTKMPNVTPPMWDFWFGWHGCLANRYKLWHPTAHKDARWADGKDDIAYIGRTSQIEEYIGGKLEKANIRFVHPSELGFAEKDIQDKNKSVFICARLGYRDMPIDFGWLVHQVRATEDGAEMRSRFFVGGEHISIRKKGLVYDFISKILRKFIKLPKKRATDLLTHCAEEMNHLSKFLPQLYQEFKNP